MDVLPSAEEAQMITLKIEICATRRSDLEDSLELILRKVQEGYEQGRDARENDDGERTTYDFSMTPEVSECP